MVETMNKNRLTEAGCICTYQWKDFAVYTTDDVNVMNTSTGCNAWCPVESNRPRGMENYLGPLYAIVKILPTGIRIKGGMDVGYGTLRYLNDKTMSYKHANEYINIVDTIYTDNVLLNIKPKMKNGVYILPDMWLLRKLNLRINETICKNKNIIRLLCKQKLDKYS
jgi:hypothetical protein